MMNYFDDQPSQYGNPDVDQVGEPSGPLPSDTPSPHTGPGDSTGELAQVGQDNVPDGIGSLSEPTPVSPLDLSTVALAHQESVSHFDAVGLATAYTDAINQAAMSAGYCELEPEGLADAGPEPD